MVAQASSSCCHFSAECDASSHDQTSHECYIDRTKGKSVFLRTNSRLNTWSEQQQWRKCYWSKKNKWPMLLVESGKFLCYFLVPTCFLCYRSNFLFLVIHVCRIRKNKFILGRRAPYLVCCVFLMMITWLAADNHACMQRISNACGSPVCKVDRSSERVDARQAVRVIWALFMWKLRLNFGWR